MSTELTTVEQSKKQAWGELGLAVHRTELQLQAQAQDIILELQKNVPQFPGQVRAAEEVYKNLRSKAVVLQNDRKKITSKLDEVSDRFRLPEQSLAPVFLSFSEALIKIKKEEEVRLSATRNIEEEKKKVREYILNETAKLELKYKAMIADKVALAYAYALGTGNVSPETLDVYLIKCISRMSKKDFPGTVVPMPVSYITQEEYVEIEKSLIQPINWLEIYSNEINSRFNDYLIAHANKEQALKIAKEEAEVKAKKDAEELANKQVANKLEAVASSPTVSTDMKALKKVFKIQMDENPENAIRILSCAVANWATVSPKIRVKKWFQFSVSNAIVAIESLKNEDSNFNPNGIIFVENDKL